MFLSMLDYVHICDGRSETPSTTTTHASLLLNAKRVIVSTVIEDSRFRVYNNPFSSVHLYPFKHPIPTKRSRPILSA